MNDLGPYLTIPIHYITLHQQVWYHGEWCSSRGRNCNNTKLTDSGGCCIWYNEPQYLGDIEEHLGVTIQQIEKDMKIAVDEFDGKVVYGAKRKDTGSGTHLQIGIVLGNLLE